LITEEKLVKFLEDQIKIEDEIVESLNEALGDMRNPAVAGTLKGISLDSVKHAEMYRAAAELLTGAPQALMEEHLDRCKRVIEKHMRIEAELIRRIGEVMPEIENEKVKLLLNAILADEKRHHALLKEVLGTLVKGETITEEEWFDVIWKAVPFHGSPGG
jgi:rubrerythrin